MKLCEFISKKNNSYKYKTLIPCNMYGKYDNFDSDTSHLIAGIIHKIHLAKMQIYSFISMLVLLVVISFNRMLN